MCRHSPRDTARRTALLAVHLLTPACHSDGQSIGAIVLGHAEAGPLAEEVLTFVRQVADSLAVAIHQVRLFDELQHSREQLRSLSHHLVNLQEAERKELCVKLHDRSASMTALSNRALGCSSALQTTHCSYAVPGDQLIQMADIVMVEFHHLADRGLGLDAGGWRRRSSNTWPHSVTEPGRDSVRRDRRGRAPAGRSGDGDLPYPESLTNVARHVWATHVSIAVAVRTTRSPCRLSRMMARDLMWRKRWRVDGWGCSECVNGQKCWAENCKFESKPVRRQGECSSGCLHTQQNCIARYLIDISAESLNRCHIVTTNVR